MNIGIDLGGTKIELYQNRVATPNENYQKIINVIVGLIESAEKEVEKECTLGVCTPGSLSPATGLLRNSNTSCLNGKPFKQDLEEGLSIQFNKTRNVRIANDANCFALSEAIDGAAEYAKTVFGVIVGTGTGGGLVVNKSLLTGCNGIAGEWGHNPLPWPEVFIRSRV